MVTEGDLEVVYKFISSRGSAGSTNHEIEMGTGLEGLHRVYLVTKRLLRQGRIRGHRYGAIWVFYAK
jgi:hypothetical protein